MAFLSHTRVDCAPAPRARHSLLDLFALRRQRLQLRRLSDAALDDLGLTREQTEAEARRGFLDTPEI